MVKLNLGCGPHGMMNWINYDLVSVPGSNVIAVDLSHGRIPQADSSVDFIFTEHFIEHLTREEAQCLLRDCRRVLRSGGVMRISTPDLHEWTKCYLEGDVVVLPGVWEPRTPAQMLNEGMRLWDHKFLYDEPELSLALREAGFAKSERSSWRESVNPELRGLEVRSFYNDLIMESVKQ